MREVVSDTVTENGASSIDVFEVGMISWSFDGAKENCATKSHRKVYEASLVMVRDESSARSWTPGEEPMKEHTQS